SAGPGIERDEAGGEEVGSFPVPPVKVVLGACGGDVDDAALLVDRLLTPVVGAADRLPRVGGPGVVAELAGARHGVEGPRQDPGAYIEGANVARRGRVLLVRRRAHDDAVLEDPAGRAALLVDRRRIPVQTRSQPHP